MAKIKLTKGELKLQRDSLRQFERFLPILQLKKQQLQMEILKLDLSLEEKRQHAGHKSSQAENWAQLLAEPVNIKRFLAPREIITATRNIAGIDIPVFEKAVFPEAEFDFFLEPLWLDAVADLLRQLAQAQEEIHVMEQSVDILRRELRITTQRVNLFEKVKIPEAKEAIRVIKIYMGDQMANAVGRSKIAKRKIFEAEAMEMAA